MVDTTTGKWVLRPVFGCELENVADGIPMRRLLDPATAVPQA